VTQPTTTTLSYTYDADGNQASYTNAAGNETTYAYNYLDELTSATDADGHVTSYTYDADGNQLTLTKPDTKVTTSSYNADDELTGVSYSDGTTHSVSYGYDPDGNVASMTDATGTSLYAYDPADRLAMYQNGAGATVTYSYDPDGDITDVAYPGGDIVTKAYDDMDRLSSLTDWLGGTTSYSYDADSDPTGLAYPNGVSSATTYDNADQLASITDTKGATTLVSFSYSRDNYGDLSSETDTGTPGAGTTSYTYTSLHQVSAAGSASYGYDAANDLTTSPAGATQAFDPAGELCWAGTGSAACTSPPSGTTTYSYSADGNRTATTPSSGPSTSYSWDQANDLTNVTTGSSSATYTYDGNGLRQSKTVGGTTTHYSWDVDGSLPLLLSDGTNSYIYGLGGTPVEQVSSSGTPTYLLADQLGSTRALTGSAGSLTATFTYDAWGNLAGSTGSATTPFMYAGQYLDSTTGLYYMQARWYEPATGQFLSVDPLAEETEQAFAYSGDDPVNDSDPSGLCHDKSGIGGFLNSFVPGCPSDLASAAAADIINVASSAGTCIADRCEDTHEGAVDAGDGALDVIASWNPNADERVTVPAEYPCVQGAYQIGEGLTYGLTFAAGWASLGLEGSEATQVAAQAGEDESAGAADQAAYGYGASEPVPNPEPQFDPDRTANRGPAAWVNVRGQDGNVTTYPSGPEAGVHAEDNAQSAVPGGQMSSAYGWRGPASDPQWTRIPTCSRCAARYPGRFPYEPGGS
jgi:RHS repeat-associated protein